MPPTKHQDKRGFFQELYHFNTDEPDLAQVSWFSIEPGQDRGGHYHLYTDEMFIVLEGDVIAKIRRSVSHEMVKEYRLGEGDLIKVVPKEVHSFHSVKGAKVLVFASRHFNPNDTDTFVCPIQP
jgi:dTDP-4-dehydrorhamnose 3,5-epimerase-like enzyme